MDTIAAQWLVRSQNSGQRSIFFSRKRKNHNLLLIQMEASLIRRWKRDYVVVLPEQLVMIWIIFKTSGSALGAARAFSQMHLENFSAYYHNPTFTGLEQTTCSVGETWCQTLFSQISQLVSQFLSAPRRHCGTSTTLDGLLILFSTNSGENITQFDGYSGHALKILPTTTCRLTGFADKGQKIHDKKKKIKKNSGFGFKIVSRWQETSHCAM